MYKNLLKRYKNIPVQARASIWFLICAFLQKAIAAITTPVFTRLLTTEEYGQFDIFNSWCGILTVCVTFNLYCGVFTRGLVKFEDDRDAFSSSLQGLTFTLTLIWLIIYLAFHSFWNRIFAMKTPQMLLMFVLIWGTVVFGFWSMGQRVDYKYRLLVGVTLVMAILKPFLGIVFVLISKDKVTARIFGIALPEGILCMCLFVNHMRKGKCFFSAQYWKHALLFNIPLLPHYLSGNVLSGADRIMIGRMVDEAAAGIYGLAYTVSLIMTMFNTALLQTMEPWLYKKIHQKRIEDIARIAYPSFVLIAIVNLLLIALAPEVIAIFAPPAYYDAIWVIPPVTMSVFFMFSYTFFAVFEFYYEKTTLITIATCVGAVANIILNYIFIRIFGYCAAGYTTLFCYVVYAAFHFLFMRKICRDYLENTQAYSGKIYVCIAGIFLTLGFLLLLSYPHRLVRYILLSVLFLTILLERNRVMKAVTEIIRTREK